MGGGGGGGGGGCNSQVHVELIERSKFDILCLCKTFLIGDETIDISNYVWYGHNREVTYPKGLFEDQEG